MAAVERERGFRNALMEAGVPADRYRANWARDGGKPLDEFVKAWKKEGRNRPTAFFGWHDGMAQAFLQICRAEGIRAPGDLSLVGIDNAPESIESQITSVPQPLHLIGKRASTLLIDRLAEPDLPDEIVRFSVEIVVRASTGPPPRLAASI